MAVNRIRDSGHNVQAARAAYSVEGVSQRASVRMTTLATRSEPSTSVRISEGADLLGKLRRLHDTRPKEFKQLMTEFASDAQARASESVGASARKLGNVAERLSEAAREGNITPLVPDLEAARTARAQYNQERDAWGTPNDDVKALFRGFVDKVNAALPALASRDPGSAKR